MYKLTATSLYAAVTTGKTTDSIVAQLQRLCKNRLQSATIDFIHHHTRDIGKLQLVEADSGMTIAVYDEAIARKMMGGELGCRLQQLGLQQHVLFQRRAQLLPRAQRLVQQLSLQRLLLRLSLQPLCQQPPCQLGFSAEAFPQAQNALPRLFLP